MSDKSKAKKIYNIVSTACVAVIFVFLVVVVALLLVQRKSGGDSKIFGYYMFDVVTDSMSGTIEPGDVILSREIEDKTALQVGDIITFTAPSGPFAGYNITHRIVEVVREDGEVYYRTKGDNPEVGEDDWRLTPDAVKAKYVKKAVIIGGLRRFITHWYGYVLLIALPLTVVGVLIIVGIVRDKYAGEKNSGAGSVSAVENMTEEQKQKLLDELLRSKNEADESENGGGTDFNAGENGNDGTDNTPD